MAEDNGNDTMNKPDERLRVFPAEAPNITAIKDKSFFLRNWKASLLIGGGLIAILWALFAALGSGWNFWGFRTGINNLVYAFILSVVTLITGVIFILWDRKRGRKPSWLLYAIGMGLAIIYAGYFLSIIAKGISVPAIHDISTDLADPPRFQALALRTDNLDDIPGQDDSDMRGLSALQRWEALHKKAYPEIRSVRIELPVADVIAKAEHLVKARGWDLSSSVPETGHLEATATSSLFRYKDDIVLRVRPIQDGKSSIIDMRSVSRVGQSDLGVNADRVQAFLVDLEKEVID